MLFRISILHIPPRLECAKMTMVAAAANSSMAALSPPLSASESSLGNNPCASCRQLHADIQISVMHITEKIDRLAFRVEELFAVQQASTHHQPTPTSSNDTSFAKPSVNSLFDLAASVTKQSNRTATDLQQSTQHANKSHISKPLKRRPPAALNASISNLSQVCLTNLYYSSVFLLNQKYAKHLYRLIFLKSNTFVIY